MLRRLTCLAMISILLFLCACSKYTSKEEPVTTDFECDVDVKYQDMNVKGHLTRSTAGTLTLDIDAPESLKGMTMIWNGESVSFKMYGLTFNVNPDSIPQSSLGQGIVNSLDAAMSKNTEKKVTDEGIVTKGEIEGGEFEIVSDSTTGNLISLSIPSLELEANFSNFAATKA